MLFTTEKRHKNDQNMLFLLFFALLLPSIAKKRPNMLFFGKTTFFPNSKLISVYFYEK